VEQLRVGVIGLGRMGQQHCRVYSTLRRAQLVGVCDAISPLGEEVAQRFGVPYFRQPDDLLTHLDAVSIATPTPSHFDLALKCLEAGVNILLEKPMTETVDQARALTQAANASPKVFQVGHIERFNPAYAELKNVLEDMSILAIAMRRLSSYKGSNRDVDVVLDLMIHDVDLALDLTGQEPASLSAYGLTAHDGAIDHAVAYLGFASGPLVSMTASRVTEQKIRSIEVTALEGYLEADLLNKSISIHRGTTAEYLSNNQRGIKYRQESLVEGIHVPSNEPLYAELQHFVDCVLDGKRPWVPAEDGLKALLTATAIRSAVQQRLMGVTRYSPPRPGELRATMIPITSASIAR
jgi:predicted dehydrogenase